MHLIILSPWMEVQVFIVARGNDQVALGSKDKVFFHFCFLFVCWIEANPVFRNPNEGVSGNEDDMCASSLPQVVHMQDKCPLCYTISLAQQIKFWATDIAQRVEHTFCMKEPQIQSQALNSLLSNARNNLEPQIKSRPEIQSVQPKNRRKGREGL